MIDPAAATLAILVLTLNSVAVLGWARKGQPSTIKVKGRRYL